MGSITTPIPHSFLSNLPAQGIAIFCGGYIKFHDFNKNELTSHFFYSEEREGAFRAAGLSRGGGNHSWKNDDMSHIMPARDD